MFYYRSEIFFVMALYVVLFAMMYSYLLIRRRERRNQQRRAFSVLTDGFNNPVSIDVDDIKLICKRYRFPSYVFLLEKYLLYLREGHSEDLHDFESVNSFLKKEIAKVHAARPYDGIEESERRIMLSIEETAQNESVKRIVKNNLDELSDCIRKSENSLRRAKSLNSWMIPLTIISFVLTVVTYIWGSKISQKDFDELDRHVSAIVEQNFQMLSDSNNTLQIPDKSDK